MTLRITGITNQGILHQLSSSSTIEITTPDGNANDRFGADFDIQSNKILVSVIGFDRPGVINNGKAYLIDGSSITEYNPTDTSVANFNYSGNGVLVEDAIVVDNGDHTSSFSSPDLVRYYFPEKGVRASNGTWVEIRDSANGRVVLYNLKEQ